MARRALPFAVPVLALSLACATDSPGRTATTNACTMSVADALFLQESLDVWAHVRTRDLGLAAQPLPWSIFYDANCAFHLNAAAPLAGAVTSDATLTFSNERVRVKAVPHTDGKLALPHGARVPVDVAAYASNTKDGTPFFTMALLSLWDARREISGSPYFAERLVSVTSHEICHTEQLGNLVGHMKNIELGAFVNIDDDVVEMTFRSDAEYAATYAQEIEALWRAVKTTDDAERVLLVQQALAMAKDRRTRFFVEGNAPLAGLEPVFVSFEGLGEWVRYRFIVTAKEWREPRELVAESPAFRGYDVFREMTGADAIAFLRGTRPSWSQDEGLAIMLLLDTLALPNWQKRALALESPFALLEEAVAAARPATDPHAVTRVSRTEREDARDARDETRATAPQATRATPGDARPHARALEGCAGCETPRTP